MNGIMVTVSWLTHTQKVVTPVKLVPQEYYETVTMLTTPDEEHAMKAKSRYLATLALGAALLGGCAAARVADDGNGLTPYPLTKSLQAGDILHLPTGTAMNFEQAMEMIAAAKVIYIGEMHTNFQAHEAQRRIIEELERRFPGQVAIGIPRTSRPPKRPEPDSCPAPSSTGGPLLPARWQ